MAAAWLKKGTAQLFRLYNLARIFISLRWYDTIKIYAPYFVTTLILSPPEFCNCTKFYYTIHPPLSEIAKKLGKMLKYTPPHSKCFRHRCIYLNKIGTKRQVAPGSASVNQPSCSLVHIKANKKSIRKPSNETDGTDVTTHSHSPSLSPTPHYVTQNSISRSGKKTGTNKVRSAFSNISVIQCNLHKAKSAWDEIANTFSKTINPIFLATEPYHDRNRAIPRSTKT